MPVVANSEATLKKDESREGDYVSGTTYEFECNQHYVQSHTESACGVDGKWTPVVDCVPSKQFMEYLSKPKWEIDI